MKKIAYGVLSGAAALLLAGCGGGGSGNMNQCIDFNGLTYCTVSSPYTGKIWLDRNLGASEVCADVNDTNCFGDYYQWGRNADGHEKPDSETNTTLASDINNVGNKFITNSSIPYDWVSDILHVDDDGSLRTAQWGMTDGSSVCPEGYRVPTEAELKAELFSADYNATNRTMAFDSFLKLPTAGYRDYGDGSFHDVNTSGRLWSVTGNKGSDGFSSAFARYADDANMTYGARALGQAVRCIMN